MALTQYPIVTDQSTVQVTLPPGRHTLELVVEDSAGMQSAPDTVIITVVREAPLPRISGITPTSALAGATLDAVIAGDNLDGATAVRFSGTGITAQILPGLIPTIRPTIGPILEATVLPTIRPTLEPPIPVPPTLQPGGTGSQLQVRLTIDPGAPVGPRSFAVTTPAGVAESPSGVTFSVIRFIPPTIEPTIFPTIEPTIRPTLEPTILPTIRPTIAPTIEPTILPTIGPTIRPTLEPTILPTIRPTIEPTIGPTVLPTIGPTIRPTLGPTIGPLIEATIRPTIAPIVDVGPVVTPDRPVIVRGKVAERPVAEVNGIGPAFSRKLEKRGITNLSKLAALEPRRLAEILDVSEVRAMALIDEARRLLRR